MRAAERHYAPGASDQRRARVTPTNEQPVSAAEGSSRSVDPAFRPGFGVVPRDSPRMRAAERAHVRRCEQSTTSASNADKRTTCFCCRRQLKICRPGLQAGVRRRPARQPADAGGRTRQHAPGASDQRQARVTHIDGRHDSAAGGSSRSVDPAFRPGSGVVRKTARGCGRQNAPMCAGASDHQQARVTHHRTTLFLLPKAAQDL